MCNRDPKVKVKSEKVGVCNGVPSTASAMSPFIVDVSVQKIHCHYITVTGTMINTLYIVLTLKMSEAVLPLFQKFKIIIDSL